MRRDSNGLIDHYRGSCTRGGTPVFRDLVTSAPLDITTLAAGSARPALPIVFQLIARHLEKASLERAAAAFQRVAA